MEYGEKDRYNLYPQYTNSSVVKLTHAMKNIKQSTMLQRDQRRKPLLREGLNGESAITCETDLHNK